MPRTSDSDELKARLTRIQQLLDQLHKNSDGDQQGELLHRLVRELEGVPTLAPRDQSFTTYLSVISRRFTRRRLRSMMTS
jgi:hypothetical protein